MANTGRSYEQIDAMSVFDLTDIFDYWASSPPANEILCALHGIKKSAKPEKFKPQLPKWFEDMQRAMDAENAESRKNSPWPMPQSK